MVIDIKMIKSIMITSKKYNKIKNGLRKLLVISKLINPKIKCYEYVEHTILILLDIHIILILLDC